MLHTNVVYVITSLIPPMIQWIVLIVYFVVIGLWLSRVFNSNVHSKNIEHHSLQSVDSCGAAQHRRAE